MKKILYILLLLPIGLNNLNAANEEILLETLGVLTVHGVLLTQDALATQYDAWVGETYSDKVFQDYLKTDQETIKGVQEQLYRLSQYGDLHYADAEYIDNLIALYDAILIQLNSMLKYSYSYSESDYKQYMYHREIVLNMIDKMFL